MFAGGVVHAAESISVCVCVCSPRRWNVMLVLCFTAGHVAKCKGVESLSGLSMSQAPQQHTCGFNGGVVRAWVCVAASSVDPCKARSHWG